MFALLSDEELKEAYGDYRESIGEERGLLTAIEKLMKNKGFSADEAMEILDIPEEKKEEYRALL